MTASNRIFFRTAAVMVATLSTPSNAQDALGNLWVTVPLKTIAPGTSHDLGVIWDGGQPPWSWTLEISQLDDPDRVFSQTGLPETVCDSPADRLRCRSFPIPTSFRWPEIATITATVEDAVGNLVTRTARVRVAGDGTFWFDGRWTVDVVEEEFGIGFDCFGTNDQDPPLVTLTGDPAFPVIDVFKDERLSTPHELIVRDESLFSFPEPGKTLYHIRNDDFDLNENPFENTLPFPLQYGDLDLLFDSPISLLSDIVPPPALRTQRFYSIDLSGYRQCNFPPTLDARFMLNPPAPGDPVLIQGLAEVIQTETVDPTLAQVLDRSRRIRLRREESVAISCMNDLFKGAVTLELLRVGVLKTFFSDKGINNFDELVFEIVTNPDVLNALRAHCEASTMGSAPGAAMSALEASQSMSPTLDLEIVSGSGRLTLADPAAIYEIRAAHGTVTLNDGTIDVAQTEDGRRSAIGSPDTEIVVTPSNPALPETTVPAGFFVTLSDTSVSAPIEFALFADGFE